MAIQGKAWRLPCLTVSATLAIGSSTSAAARLYLTQSAVSAALQRLTTAIGAALFVRHGRGLALTARGGQLLASARLHLAALVTAALAPPVFDPRTSERTLRLGLADASEVWLLPALLRAFEHEAPRMRVVAIPVNFRTVGDALAGQQIDAAITVADDLPPTIRREPLHPNAFACLCDPRHARPGRLSEADYFAHDHVVVSHNGDLRGVIEDVLRKQRRIRCSVSTFANLGALLDGSALLATVPELVARYIQKVYPQLRIVPLPFAFPGTATTELLWPAQLDDDEPWRFARTWIHRIAQTHAAPPRRGRATPRRAAR